jgi:hypothetical protein
LGRREEQAREKAAEDRLSEARGEWDSLVSDRKKALKAFERAVKGA